MTKTTNPKLKTTKPKAIRDARRKAKKAAKAAPKLTPIEKVLRFVNPDGDTNTLSRYDSIIGRNFPIDELSASNLSGTARLAEGIANALQRLLTDSPGPVAVRTQRLSVTPGSAAEFDIPAIRKAAMTRGVNTIAGIRMYPVPEPSDASGLAIAIDMIGLLWGPNVQNLLQRARRTHNARSFRYAESASVAWLQPNDEAGLRKAVQQIVMPCLSLPLSEERASDDVFPANWKDGRVLRAFIMVQTGSMLAVKRKLIAAGAGKAILTGEIAQAEHRLGEVTKVGPSPIHRDGVVHFWFREMARLGLTGLTVPLIKLR
jgi:hypothetical protein